MLLVLLMLLQLLLEIAFSCDAGLQFFKHYVFYVVVVSQPFLQFSSTAIRYTPTVEATSLQHLLLLALLRISERCQNRLGVFLDSRRD